MMDPIGLGAGSYPEPPENENKLFSLKVKGYFEGYVEIYAKDVTTAVNDVMNGNFHSHDLEMESYEIEDIENCKEI